MLKPSTVRNYVTKLRLILDYAGVAPNPARDKNVKLPAVVAEEPDPPSAGEFLAILDASAPRWGLPLVVLEQTAIRVGELQSLTWGTSTSPTGGSESRAATPRPARPGGCKSPPGFST